MLGSFRKIAVKLAILAGVPVIGALLLSAHIAREAGERARSTEGIGSIEDLAELSARMTDTIGELQTERALAALVAGFEAPDAASLDAQEAKTDQAVRAMEGFLAKRDLSRLPRRLGGDLNRARAQLRELGQRRQDFSRPDASIDVVLRFYGETNYELINASAALTQLSNDGELLRALSTLVATMQVKERGSREHAVLNNTFAHGEFAPGLYRYFVTLVTEEGVYVESLRSLATDEQARLFERALRGGAAEQAAEMRKKALETTEGDFGVDVKDWYATQSSKIAGLRAAEREFSRQVREVAKRKVSATQSALTYSRNLVVAVVAISLLLTWLIGRGISRSVLGLASAAGRVQKEKDFSLRARKTSHDELGALTDAFNEMLAGLEVRDEELLIYRQNLEALVAERTLALQRRNEDMRLVLDTVEQGMVTLKRDGSMSNERSRAFDAFFGAPAAETPFYEHLSGADSKLASRLKFDWDQLVEGVLPAEVVLSQAKSRIERDGVHYALSYKPICEGESVQGALLTVSNVTSEVAARAAEATQREQSNTIGRLLKDRAGFLVFFTEARKLVEHIRQNGGDTAELIRAVHTLKGNAALFDVNSVSEAAHGLEQALVDRELEQAPALMLGLQAAWDTFSQRIGPVLGNDLGDRFELTRAELEQLFQAAKPYPQIEALIRHIEHEPVQKHLSRAADQLERLAQRLGKAELEVTINANAVRLPSARFASFWAAFAHVVRNVADHGLHTSEERRKLGKSSKNRVELKARQLGDEVVIEVTDDGRGVDWEKLRERAKQRGLSHQSTAELELVLFTSGISTSEKVSSTSGRGVGMSAIAEACRSLGGTCKLSSERGRGAKITFVLPVSQQGRVETELLLGAHFGTSATNDDEPLDVPS
jgi:two-component system chemotaxis sensor kinase CheA